MVISHSKKFIFIHVYKVAGTSISKELAKYSDFALYTFRPYRFLARKLPQVFPLKYTRHMTALQLKKVEKPEVFNHYFKFAFVRNPWDWQVSQYHYILGKKTHHQHQLVKGFKDYSEYIEWVVTTKITTQKDMLCDENGKLLMDFVGKYENLNEDFNTICDKIGIPRIDLPHLNKSKKKGYQSYYTERTRELVRKAYQDDIELFDYEF